MKMRSKTCILSMLIVLSVMYGASVNASEVASPYNFTITMEYNSGGTRDITAGYVKQNLAPIGIKVTLDGGPWYRCVADYLSGTIPYDMMILGITGGGMHPDPSSTSHSNTTIGYLNCCFLNADNTTQSYMDAGVAYEDIARADFLLENIPTTLEPIQKTEYTLEWQDLFTDNIFSYYPTYNGRSIWAVPTAFDGYDPDEGVIGSLLRGAGWTSGGNDGPGGEDDTFCVDIGSTSSWNPYASKDSSSSDVYQTIYDTLVTYDKDYNFMPRVASNWTVNEDLTYWEFYVPNDLHTFTNPNDLSDTSMPVTAQDVLFTTDMMMSETFLLAGNQGGSMIQMGLHDWGQVDDTLDATDSQWIYFNLTQATSDIWIAWSIYIMPYEYITGAGGTTEPWGYPSGGCWNDLKTNGYGSGYYYVDDCEIGASGYVTLKLNPNLYLHDDTVMGTPMTYPNDHTVANVYTEQPSVTTYNMPMIADQEVTWTKFLTGEIDIRGLTDRGRITVEEFRNDNYYQVADRQATGFGFIGFAMKDNNLGGVHGIELRHAVAYLIDPEDLNQACFDGMMKTAYSYISYYTMEKTGHIYVATNGSSVLAETLYKYKFNWERAKAIMQNLGYDTTANFLSDENPPPPGTETLEKIIGMQNWFVIALTGMVGTAIYKKRK